MLPPGEGDPTGRRKEFAAASASSSSFGCSSSSLSEARSRKNPRMEGSEEEGGSEGEEVESSSSSRRKTWTEVISLSAKLTRRALFFLSATVSSSSDWALVFEGSIEACLGYTMIGDRSQIKFCAGNYVFLSPFEIRACVCVCLR